MPSERLHPVVKIEPATPAMGWRPWKDDLDKVSSLIHRVMALTGF